MQTISALEIRDAFVAKILTITPTFESLRDIRWDYVPSGRKNGRSALPPKTRSFDIIVGAGVPFYGWGGGAGTAYSARFAIATSYAGVSMDQIEPLLTDDGVDLRRALNQLRDPTLPGLTNVITVGVQNLSGDSQANLYAEHVFEVQYHQRTR